MPEIVINDANYTQFLSPQIVDGEQKVHGLMPRSFDTHPLGFYACAKPFDIPLIPENEWQSRLDAKIAAKAQLSDIRNTGMNGQPIPARDQDGKGFCATSDTEILSNKGWVPYPAYDWETPIATVNQLTHLMEFQQPTHRHVYEYDGPMVYSTNRRIDFGVTPDHRMFVRKWDERKRTLSETYSFQPAGSIGWYAGLMHAPAGQLGTELLELGVEGDRDYDGEDFLALIALICSDGWAGGSDATRNWVSFCCFVESRYQKVAALAARIGFHEKPSKRGVWARYDAGALAQWVRENCYASMELRAPNKKIPDIVKVAGRKQIEHFLDFFGDQNHTGQKGVFYSASKRMIDDLQELHLRIGKRGTISEKGPRSTVYAETGQTISSGPSFVLVVGDVDTLCIDRKKHIETDRYKGLVYCATVPNGTLVTRRNGSVLISGNCWAHSSTSAALLIRAINHEPYADLSAFMVACIIKGYQDQGGWGAESLEFIAQNGIPTSEFWPQQSMSRSNDTPAMRANAALHKYTQWMDLDPQNMKAQLVTCLLLGLPVVSDFNWWSHSVCTIDLVKLSPFTTRIWNSWSDKWSENGTGLLEGSKAIPDSGLAARVMTPSGT